MPKNEPYVSCYSDKVVAEEQQLLGPVHADEAGEQVGAAGVGHDPAPHEHLDEPGQPGPPGA